MKKIFVYCLTITLLALSSCTSKGWSVSGKIDNAPDGSKLSVEGLNGGYWYNIDSVEVSADGAFKYVAQQGSPYPDIYRVSLDGRCIYFPIDSIESVTITADGSNFDRDYTLAGSDLAVEMMNVDKRIAEFVAAKGVEAALTDSVFKRELSETINNDNTGVLAYYLVNKTIGNRPIFDPAKRADVRTLGAIANKFITNFPDDPRTEYLKQRYLASRSALGDYSKPVMEANEAGIIDMEFYDVKGQKRKLSDVASKAGVTLLSFTSYNIEPSLAYNVELNRLYQLFGPQNIAIYQVSIDEDEVDWRNNAQNLPWVALRGTPEQVTSLLNLYNVTSLPTTFIIDKNVDLVERVDGDPTPLEGKIRKHL